MENSWNWRINMSGIALKENPFFLKEEDIEWIEKTKANMTIDEKIGQLFFTIGMSSKKKDIENLVNSIRPGGMMFRPSSSKKVAEAHKLLQKKSKIPMLLAANLESGGDGLIEDGTFYGHEMLTAAAGNEKYAYRLGLVAGTEAAAVGGNTAFAPIIDINYNFRNPITNIRCFGDNPDNVAKMGAAYVKGAHEAGICVTIKHFPGDGTDGRDQHLLTTYNNLSYEDWMKTFGKAYKTSIDAGARGLMAGHIGFPAYIEKIKPKDETAKKLPATLNADLLKGLLRGELNYNGVILTDASLMTGFGQHGERRNLVPQCIAAGCDMFLFNRMPEDDYQFMMDGYKNGVITEERLDEALTRILALKASLGLHKKTLEELVPDNLDTVDMDLHKKWAKELADKSVTLVKDQQNILPLDPNKCKKIGVIFNGNDGGMAAIFKNMPGLKGALLRLIMKLSNKGKPAVKVFVDKLKEQGFDAFEYEFNDIFTLMKEMTKTRLSDWKKQFDVIIYLAKWETASNQTSLQLQYKAMGFDAPWFVKEIPTILVSVANPYHGYDMEMVETIINGYSPTESVYEAIAEKIAGKSEFKGISPVKLTFEEFTGKI